MYALQHLREHYADFNGRARRSEYWLFQLFTSASFIFVSALESMLAWRVGASGVLMSLYATSVLLPLAAVQVRRLHDIGLSGWWVLMGAVPGFGPILLTTCSLIDSQKITNQFGPNPKASAPPCPAVS